MYHEHETRQLLEEDRKVTYLPKLTRRESLRWLGLLSASIMAPNISAVAPTCNDAAKLKDGHWPNLDIKPLASKGYGKDPKLISPPISAWPRTLTKKQFQLVAILSEIVVPREGSVPSAVDVNVPDVIDEWVSAPYPRQQRDRVDFLHAFVWFEDESHLRFKTEFVKLTSSQKIAIMDDVAYQRADMPEKFKRISCVFSRFRHLVVAAYFCSPEGTKDLGYVGNVAIAGDYPGPSEEAVEHLNGVLKNLGL